MKELEIYTSKELLEEVNSRTETLETYDKWSKSQIEKCIRGLNFILTKPHTSETKEIIENMLFQLTTK